MDYYATSQCAKVRVLLTFEELQFPAIDEVCRKFNEWLQISKESGGRTTRKTRSANRKTDSIYEEIMAFKAPLIKLNPASPPIVIPQHHYHHQQQQPHQPPPRSRSADTSIDTDSDSSSTRPITRSLRPRSRTPTIQQTTPCTPTHQRIRAHMNKPNSSSNGSSSVLSTALAQGHPKVSVTKIKQLLKYTDSAQKRRDEEKERQARLIHERKTKEERAEAQRKAMLEERAENAKQNREKRLNHAAELRKAREEAKAQQKLREQETRKAMAAMAIAEDKLAQQQYHHPPHPSTKKTAPSNEAPAKKQKNDVSSESEPQVPPPAQAPAQVPRLNETFKKPSEDVNNIDISIQDETSDEIQKDKIPQTAAWTKAPHLRDALISQFSKSDTERHKEVLEVFPSVQLPVELDKIFGSSKAVNTRYLCRTSSAVWSPPNRALKRSSSMVMTPTRN